MSRGGQTNYPPSRGVAGGRDSDEATGPTATRSRARLRRPVAPLAPRRVRRRARRPDAARVASELLFSRAATVPHSATSPRPRSGDSSTWHERRIDVTIVGSGGRDIAGVRVHRSRSVDERDVLRSLTSLRVTSPARTLLDLAAILPAKGSAPHRAPRAGAARGLDPPDRTSCSTAPTVITAPREAARRHRRRASRRRARSSKTSCSISSTARGSSARRSIAPMRVRHL